MIYSLRRVSGKDANWLVYLSDMRVKAPSVKSMEIDIINEGTDSSRGVATWISCGLKIEETQLMLALEARNIDPGATENQ